jgi:hypothetical protein
MDIGKEEIALGAIVGVAKVEDIRPFTKADAALLNQHLGTHMLNYRFVVNE